MAVFSFIPVAPTTAGNNTLYAATLGSAANSTVITPGNDAIIRIASTGNLTIRFGKSAALTTTPAGATDMLFPAGVYIYDMGHNNDSISIYSLAASNVITVNLVPRN